ncbi:hypothetical protein [Desulfallas thermosapovorans]|uniref:Uncharacterized protein n=1 Tax=Desulfallas thermosapovorans DSM 6562 TaxID=1121431 RepID=A0A5S4ZQM1_9FIRM|nr:hypothetical protein [Desulfallas thermosapovorans]TYO94916.1 hypothetical protein LX24_01931 [Desulfallas thermosapovorans DSM 6562]
MSKTFFPMMLTVFAAVGTYYLLATETVLSESISMTAGVAVGVFCAVATRKIMHKK